ncbi:hypothetical protein HK104_008354 [Borealophlyctis nickersoniae]|nr:hypothetical protein HK104_008354 [Borealophlyctis nickersoniae]
MDFMMFPPLPSKPVVLGGAGLHNRGQTVLAKSIPHARPQHPSRRGSTSSTTSSTSSLEDEGYGSFEDSSPIKNISGKDRAVSVSPTPSGPTIFRRGSEVDNMLAFEMDMDVVVPKSDKSSPSLAAALLPELLRIVLAMLDDSDSSLYRQRTLAACCLVNRYWHGVATGALWQAPELLTEHAFDRFVKGCILSSRGASVKHGNGIFVRRLDLNRIRLHEPTHTPLLRVLASACTTMRSLKLWCEQLSMHTLQILALASPHLDTLVVAGHLANWHDTALHSFTTLLSRLHTIQIDVGFDGDAGRARLARLVSTNVGPTLRHFRMAGADSDTRVASITRRCPNLQVLLYGWSNLTESALRTVASTLPDLRVLDLRGCQRAVTPLSMDALVLGCPALESLDISFTSGGDAVIHSLVAHASNLHTLIMAGYACSEPALVRLLHYRGAQLKVLSLAWFGGNMTDATVRAMAKYCTRLEKLDLRGCANVSEDALRGLVEGCGKLRVFKLEGPGGWGGEDAMRDDTQQEQEGGHHHHVGVPMVGHVNGAGAGAGAAGGVHPAREFLDELRRTFYSEELVRLEESMM